MKVREKILAIFLAMVLVVGLFPCTAFAEDEKVLTVSVNDCKQIGTEDGDPVYLYMADDYDGETAVKFTDFSEYLCSDDGMVASFGNAYVKCTDTAPISNGYLVGNHFDNDEDFEPADGYSDFDFSDTYGYWMYDEDYSLYYFIVKLPGEEDIDAPFTVSKGEITGVEKNTYLYDDWSGAEVNADLYTVKVPFGTQDEVLSFTEDRIAYGYSKSGEYLYSCSQKANGYDNNGKTGEKKANVSLTNIGSMPGYVIVQTPYDESWNSDTLYAVQFETTYSFSAKAVNEDLGKIAYEKDGYKYDSNMYDADNTGDTPVALYTITVPDGTASVDLSFSDNVLAYNYNAKGEYVYGSYEDFYTGAKTATVDVDHNKDGEFDVIQVQTPYDSFWNTDVLYGISFKYESGINPPAAPYTKGKYTLEELVSSIASGYSKNGAVNDANYPWIAADMAAYAKTYPESAYVFSEAQKKDIANRTIELVSKSSASAGDLSKGILALCALGYDPTKVTATTGDKIDVVDKLLAIAFNDEDRTAVSNSVKSEYTLPWVISAVSQFDGKYEEELKALVEAEADLVYDSENDRCKLSFSWGTDGAAYILDTIGPFYDKNDKNSKVTKAVDAIKKELKKEGTISFNDDGAIVSWGSTSAESTALLIAGLVATGENPDEFFDVINEQSGEKTTDIDLSKGLLSLQNADSTGFKSSGNAQMATEQGFRGLIALVNAEDGDNYTLYDFNTKTLEPVEPFASGVSFKVIPENANVELKNEAGETVNAAAYGNNVYELGEGEYSYTVSLDGYADKTGTVTITKDDADKKIRQEKTISLTRKVSDNEKDDITVTVKVYYHEADDNCKNDEGTITYKNDADKYVSALSEESYKAVLPNGSTARDALVMALDDSDVSYVEESNGYFSSINDCSELSHGPNSGWMYMVNKVTPDVAANQYVLKNRDIMVWYFTDDYTNDMGSDKINSSGSGNNGEDVDTSVKFIDVPKGSYFEKPVDWAVKKGITTGTTETTFSPDKSCTRAEAVTFLWRAAGSPEVKAEVAFTDVKKGSYYEKAVAWAVAKGITSGTTETTFSPDDNCTRAQIVTFMARMAGKEDFNGTTDFNDVKSGSYYENSVAWAVKNEITTGTTETTFSPDDNCTRAHVVTFLYRYAALNETEGK